MAGIAALDAAEAQHVLGALLHQHVDHIVHRDDAEHPLVGRDHRQRQEVVLGDQAGDLLLIGLGRDRHKLGRHDRADAPLGRGGDHRAQGDHTDELLGRVEHIQVRQALHLRVDQAQMGDHLGGSHLGAHLDELLGHQPPGALRRVLQEQPHLGGIIRLHRRQQILLSLGHIFGQDLGDIVHGQAIEQVAGLVGRQVLKQFAGGIGAGLVQHFGGLPRWE